MVAHLNSIACEVGRQVERCRYDAEESQMSCWRYHLMCKAKSIGGACGGESYAHINGPILVLVQCKEFWDVIVSGAHLEQTSAIGNLELETIE